MSPLLKLDNVSILNLEGEPLKHKLISTDSTLLDGLVSHWKLDEISGVRYDSHSSVNLVDNLTVSYSVGKIGNSASFDGSNYLSAPTFAFAGGDSFTVSAWINFDSLPSFSEIVSCWKGAPSPADYKGMFAFPYDDVGGLYTPYKGLQAMIGLTDNTTPHNGLLLETPVIGTWYFVTTRWNQEAQVADASLNGGTPIILSSGTTGLTVRSSLGAELQIGASESSGIFNFSGKIDSTSFWNRALTDGEILALYNSSSGLNYGSFQFTNPVSESQFSLINSKQPIYTYVSKTANYTILSSDYTINCTTNSFTVTLPTAVGVAGTVYNIKNSGVGTTITVDTTSSQTIDGTLLKYVSYLDCLSVQSTGASWIII